MGASSAIDRETDGAGITAYVTGGSAARDGPLASDDPKQQGHRHHCQRMGRTACCPDIKVGPLMERDSVAAETGSVRATRYCTLAF